MAVLPDNDRLRIWRGLSRWFSNNREQFALTKADFKAAINATDVWIDNNQASFNSALPVVARNNMTLSQKTLMFCAVALMRQGLNYLRYIFPEVD